MKSKLSILFGCMLLLAACGGTSAVFSKIAGNPTPASAVPSIRYSQQASASNTGYGFSSSSVKAQLSSLGSFSLMSRLGMFLFQAGGGSSSVSLAGSYNGYIAVGQYKSSAPASGGWLPAFGFGSNNVMVTSYSEIEPSYYGTSASSAINSTNFGNPKTGVPVIGSGEITNLVVIADSAGGSQSDSGTVQLLDGGVPLSGATCSLGSNQRCEVSGLTIPINDGDVLQAAIEVFQADTYQRIDVIATKQ